MHNTFVYYNDNNNENKIYFLFLWCPTATRSLHDEPPPLFEVANGIGFNGQHDNNIIMHCCLYTVTVIYLPYTRLLFNLLLYNADAFNYVTNSEEGQDDLLFFPNFVHSSFGLFFITFFFPPLLQVRYPPLSLDR